MKVFGVFCSPNEATVKGFYKSIFAAAVSWRSLFLRTHSPSLSSKSGLIWRLTGGGVFTSIYTNLISSKQSDFWVCVTAGTKLFTMVFGGWNHPQHDIYSLKSILGLVHMTWTVIRYVQCWNSLKSPEAHTQSKSRSEFVECIYSTYIHSPRSSTVFLFSSWTVRVGWMLVCYNRPSYSLVLKGDWGFTSIQTIPSLRWYEMKVLT